METNKEYSLEELRFVRYWKQCCNDALVKQLAYYKNVIQDDMMDVDDREYEEIPIRVRHKIIFNLLKQRKVVYNQLNSCGGNFTGIDF